MFKKRKHQRYDKSNWVLISGIQECMGPAEMNHLNVMYANIYKYIV